MKLSVISSMIMVTVLLAGGADAADAVKPAPKAVPPAKSASGNSAALKITEPITGMEFVPVKGGCFFMGDVFGGGGTTEMPVHEVCVPGFLIGKFEVTQAQWQKVMGTNPTARMACGPDCPVTDISWDMAQAFIAKLNGKGGAQYRLPTEAEWEFAARSGRNKGEKWAGTSDENSIGQVAWFEKNSNELTHKAGLKRPNSFGLFDMSGNVAEWCQDYFDETYYAASPKDNPTGPAAGVKRVLRGGSYSSNADEVRTTFRNADDPAIADGNYGFRVVKIAR